MRSNLRRWAIRSTACLALAAAASPHAAKAALFDFKLKGPGFTSSGTVTTTGPAGVDGGFLIDAVTGTVNGATITKLLAPGTYPPGMHKNDNLLYLTGPHLDVNGVSFKAGNNKYNIFYNFDVPGFRNGYYDFSTNLGQIRLTSFQLKAVPEPAALAVFGVGLLGLAFATRRRA